MNILKNQKIWRQMKVSWKCFRHEFSAAKPFNFQLRSQKPFFRGHEKVPRRRKKSPNGKSPNMSKTVIVAQTAVQMVLGIETTAPNGEISLDTRVCCLLVDFRTFSVGLYL